MVKNFYDPHDLLRSTLSADKGRGAMDFGFEARSGGE